MRVCLQEKTHVRRQADIPDTGHSDSAAHRGRAQSETLFKGLGVGGGHFIIYDKVVLGEGRAVYKEQDGLFY